MTAEDRELLAHAIWVTGRTRAVDRFPLADALMPLVEAIARRRAAEELDAARQYAREATRQGFAEGRGEEFTRHWAATAGWLKHRREALEEGREADWPDAAYFAEAITDALTDHEETL